MNVCCFNGNVCRSIELRKTQSGDSVGKFSLAINEGKDKTEFVNLIAFGKTADLINQYVNKGDKIAVTTRVQTQQWDDKDGNKRYSTEFIISKFDFPARSSNQDLTKNTVQDVVDDIEDSIPF